MTFVAQQKINYSSPPSLKDEIDCLQVVTCGSVDSGKSTLIGRLLFDAQLVYEDQLTSLKKDTKKYSSVSEDMDFSLLLDGLRDEREQGITIDLAYRFFQISNRRFIIADAPGHEQYTKNMAAGASNSDLGIIVVDSEKGILPQTIRHTHILYLMGVRHFILCINKMDLLNYSQIVFNRIFFAYEAIINSFSQDKNEIILHGIPLSAAKGDNVVYKSNMIDWYKGESLLSYLNTVNVEHRTHPDDFMMQIQLVSKPKPTFRCYMGTILEGTVRPGDKIKILPSGQESKIKNIIVFNNDTLQQASQGESVALTLEDELDIVRGDLIINKNNPIKMADHLRVNLLCIEKIAVDSSLPYLFKFNNKLVSGTLSAIKENYNLDPSAQNQTDPTHLNEFEICDAFLSQKIPFKPYKDNKNMGSFLIIDRISKRTVGVGMILFDLSSTQISPRPSSSLSKESRSQLKAQKPCVLWFTGPSNSNNTKVAHLVEEKLFDKGCHTYLIEESHLPKTLEDFGITDNHTVRHTQYLAKHLIEAGLITLVVPSSSYQETQENNSTLFEAGEFVAVMLDDSSAASLNKKTQLTSSMGEDHYESPHTPQITLDLKDAAPEDLADTIVNYLANHHLGRKV